MSTYENGSPADQSAGTGDMKERAVEAVAEVDAGAMYVAGVAGEEVGSVAHDAKEAARGFFDETRVQLADQASSQQRRAAAALRGTGDELEGLASGNATGSGGMATSAVRAVGEQTRRVADWLEQREPADVVREVRSYARRHTGAFLVISLGVGLVAGRLTRALMADAKSGSTRPGGSAAASGAGRPTLAAGSAGTAGGASAGWTGSAAGADQVGAGAGTYDERTPIADALAGQGPGETVQDQWAPSDEARR